MRPSNAHPSPSPDSPSVDISCADNRRRHDRVPCVCLQCYDGDAVFGEIIDLSISGMRVVRKGRAKTNQGDLMNLQIKWQDMTLTVKVRVMWISQLARRQQLVGLSFKDLTPELKGGLIELASLRLLPRKCRGRLSR